MLECESESKGPHSVWVAWFVYKTGNFCTDVHAQAALPEYHISLISSRPQIDPALHTRALLSPPLNSSRVTRVSSWQYEGFWQTTLPPMGEESLHGNPSPQKWSSTPSRFVVFPLRQTAWRMVYCTALMWRGGSWRRSRDLARNSQAHHWQTILLDTKCKIPHACTTEPWGQQKACAVALYRLHALYCWVILTPPSFCSRPEIVPTSWQALKLIVPAGKIEKIWYLSPTHNKTTDL